VNEKGRMKVLQFSWEDSAEKLIDALIRENDE
jgi:hypothetical protein